MSETDFARNVTIQIDTREVEADFVFTLGEPEKGSKRQLVVTKALHVEPGDVPKLEFKFTSRFAFFVASIEQGDIVKPFSEQRIQVGQRTKLELSGNELFFTHPENGRGGKVMAENKTGNPLDFGLGILTDGGMIVPAYFWESVPDSASVVVEAPLVLRCYTKAGYKEGQITKSEISDDPTFEMDLRELSESSIWSLRYDRVAKGFVLRQAE